MFKHTGNYTRTHKHPHTHAHTHARHMVVAVVEGHIGCWIITKILVLIKYFKKL